MTNKTEDPLVSAIRLRDRAIQSGAHPAVIDRLKSRVEKLSEEAVIVLRGLPVPCKDFVRVSLKKTP